MTIRLVGLVTVAALAAACERPGEGAAAARQAAETFKGMVAYPRSSLVSTSTGGDAVQVVLTTPAPVQTVATWYRELLRLNGWELRADAVLNDGSISIYADSGKRPLWITLRTNVGAPGTTYTLIGPVPGLDTTAAQRSGSSMSSKRIQRR
jgi:hypothetical protein